jgi:plastocyanin
MNARNLALALCAPFAAGASASPQATNVVPVQLYSFGYAPNPIVLRAGVPVTLVFTYRAGIGHELKAESFFRSSRILAGNAAAGEIDLRPRQSTSVTLVPARGAYPVHCGHFLHTQMGMSSTIYVR